MNSINDSFRGPLKRFSKNYFVETAEITFYVVFPLPSQINFNMLCDAYFTKDVFSDIEIDILFFSKYNCERFYLFIYFIIMCIKV